jgi:methyl-accepting chemotaxis protein
MRFFRDMPIRRKLLLVIALTACMGLMIACGAFVGYERATFRSEARRTTAVIADVVAENSTAALSFDDRPDAEEVLKALRAEPDISVAGLYDQRGGLFVSYSRAGLQVASPPAPGVDGAVFESGQITLVRPVMLNNQRIGSLRVQASLERVNARIRRYLEISALVLVVSLILSLLLSVGVQRVISSPILSLVETARRISEERDFSVRAKRTSGDEIGVLAGAFNDVLAAIEERSTALTQANRSLEEQTAELLEGARTVAASASQILAAASRLAATSNESAAAVAETTDTVNELRQTSDVASHKAQHVARSAQEMAQISQAGTKSVEQTVGGIRFVQRQIESVAKSMVSLGEQSQAIGQIIAAVENLAKQTNLLAVNAAIEANEAGEHGKGFSVVAQEVRNLAEQSRQATAQVREILGDIRKAANAAVVATEQGTKAVELGVNQSTRAGEAIHALGESVAHAAHAADEIAGSSREQMAGINQVAAAIEGLKQTTNENVASARHLEVAARGLHELGQKLRRIAEKGAGKR